MVTVDDLSLLFFQIFSFRDNGESQIEKADEALQKVMKDN